LRDEAVLGPRTANVGDAGAYGRVYELGPRKVSSDNRKREGQSMKERLADEVSWRIPGKYASKKFDAPALPASL
jgi:hypothetical protein